MSWALILPYVKKLGPYIAVAAVIFGVWMHGRSTGAAKWKLKAHESAGKYEQAVEAGIHAEREIIKLREQIRRQNEAYAALEREGYERTQAIKEAHRMAMDAQIRASSQAMEDARRETDDLRVMVREMSVLEACHAAWLEVAR